MLDFLDMISIITVFVLIILAYIIHLDQKVRDHEYYDYESYTHLNALIDDFKVIGILIIVFICVVLVLRGIFVIFSYFF